MRAIIGTGLRVLGYIGWDGDSYVVKGEAMKTKDLADKLHTLEHYSGLSGEALVAYLPNYFDGTKFWAMLE